MLHISGYSARSGGYGGAFPGYGYGYAAQQQQQHQQQQPAYGQYNYGGECNLSCVLLYVLWFQLMPT